MVIEFRPSINPTYLEQEIISLSMGSHNNSNYLYPSVQGLLNSKSIDVAALYENNELRSFAMIMERTWKVKQAELTAFSIGLVTTLLEYRSMGFASRLINELSEYCRDCRGASFIYLQGINGFYTQLGFSGFAHKSKYIFELGALRERKAKAKKAGMEDLSTVSNIYKQYARLLEAHSERDILLWRDLLGSLNKTFLFYEPLLVYDQDDKVCGYFCTSPESGHTIREFVPALGEDCVDVMLSYIKTMNEFSGENYLEIFSYYSFNNPVFNTASRSYGADFCAYIRPNSSNMIKWLRPEFKQDPNAFDFLFQADNL